MLNKLKGALGVQKKKNAEGDCDKSRAVAEEDGGKQGGAAGPASPPKNASRRDSRRDSAGQAEVARLLTRALDWGNDADLGELFDDSCRFRAPHGEWEGKKDVIAEMKRAPFWGKHSVAIDSGPIRGEDGAVVMHLSAKVNPSVWNGMVHMMLFVDTITFTPGTSKVASITRETAATESFAAIAVQLVASERRLRLGVAEMREMEGKGEKGWGIGDLSIGLRVIANEHEEAYKGREPLSPNVFEIASRPVVDDALRWLRHADAAYSKDVPSLLENLNRGGETYTAGDILATAFHSSLARAGHTLVVDKVNCAVVLSVKGTDSLPDVVRDVCALPTRFEKRYWTHEGMTLSARWFVDNLSAVISSKCAETGFKPVVTGHSLGAGIAALTARLFREGPVPGAVCWAYACPSCASEDLCVEMEGYVNTVVSELDIIPRLSLTSVEALRREVAGADWSKSLSPGLRARLGKMQQAAGWGKEQAGKAGGKVAALTPKLAVMAVAGGSKAMAAGMGAAKSAAAAAATRVGNKTKEEPNEASPRTESGLLIPQHPPGRLWCLSPVAVGGVPKVFDNSRKKP